MRTLGQLLRESYRPDLQPTAPELLEVLDFWERYPQYLGGVRGAVRFARQHRDQIAVNVSWDYAREELVPVVDKSAVDTQLCLPIDGYSPGLHFIRLVIRGMHTETLAEYQPVAGEMRWALWLHRIVMFHAQEAAERILCPELERRGMDCSALVVSGRVCRNVCEGLEGLGNPALNPWPDVAGTLLNTLHPTDRDAVQQAKRYLMRLRTQLISAVGDGKPAPPPPSAAKTEPPASTPTVPSQPEAPAGEDKGGRDDPSSWVPAVSLWKEKFSTIKEVNKFRQQHPEMFRNPSKFKLTIHAGLWARYWADRDKAGFEALDGDLPSVADDPNVQDDALAAAAQRMANLRAKKKAGKQ